MDIGQATLYGALAGAGATVLGLFLTSLLTYLTNKSNFAAKQYELVFEERLKAFRAIYEAMSKANAAIDNLLNDEYTRYYLEIEGFGVLREYYSDFITSKADVLKVYYHNRLYLPQHIDAKIKKYANETLFSRQEEPEHIVEDQEIAQWHIERVEEYLAGDAPRLKDKYSEEILREMNKSMGFK